MGMTRDEAEREVERLSREHADRETHKFVAREDADGSWSIAKVAVPAALRRGPLKTTAETRPRPPDPGDPRTAHERNTGGLPGGLA